MAGRQKSWLAAMPFALFVTAAVIR